MSTRTEARRYIDCREMRSENTCSLRISGTEDEVLAVAVQHAVATHGHRGSDELRAVLRRALKDEE